jgi:hypothetical protein
MDTELRKIPEEDASFIVMDVLSILFAPGNVERTLSGFRI